MYEKKVLIVYGSRYGATEEAALKIKQLLEEKNLHVNIFNSSQIEKQELPELKNYAGIIIGTGIKMSMWVKSLKKFVNEKKEELQHYRGIKAFYVSSAFAADTAKYEGIKNEYITTRLDKLGLEFDLVEAFGGKLDLSSKSKMTWLDKKMVEIVSKQYDDVKNKIIDLRDWKKIENFANEFINLVS